MAKCIGLQAISVEKEKHGLIWGMYPGGWPMLLPDFNLVYIISLWDYYLYSGDLHALREVYPSVLKSLKFFEKHTAKDSLLTKVPEWVFIDWAPLDKTGKSTALNIEYVGALEGLARIAEALGKKQDAKKFAARAQRVRAAVNEKLFNERRGVYMDCLPPGEKPRGISEHSNSLAILFDVAPREKWDGMLAYVLDEKKNVVRAGSPYFSFYVLGAILKAGRTSEAFAYMRRWKMMLDAGATTWWEHWKAGASHCHGWSAAPTFYLSHDVLGVRPAKPGWKTVEIAPLPGALKEAKGTVPTPQGDITAAWKSLKTEFRLEVKTPKGCGTTIRVPLGKKGSVSVNGKKALPRGLKRLEDEDGRAVLVSSRGGKWVVETS
jgi:hypothetical protein